MNKPLPDKTIDVSAIIVNWNTKDLLLSCVRSLITNTHKVSLEIIVVDNDSKDGSQEVLKQHFPDVTLIQNKENLGFAKANNIGIRASSGKYICLVNSDVELKNECLDKMKDYIDQHTEIGMLGPKIYYPDGKIQSSCKRFPTLWRHFCEAICFHRIAPQSKLFAGEKMTFFTYDKILGVDCLIGAFWFIRRKALEQVGLLDENFFFYSEDFDWCKRFWNHGWQVVFFPNAEIIHHTGSSSKKIPIKYYIQQRRAKLQYWDKHHGWLSTKCIKVIMMLHQIVRILLQTLIYINPSSRETALHKIKRSVACILWLPVSKNPHNK